MRAHEDGFRDWRIHLGAKFSIEDNEWMQAMEFAAVPTTGPSRIFTCDRSERARTIPGKGSSPPWRSFLWLAKELPEPQDYSCPCGSPFYALDHSVPNNFYFDLAACPLPLSTGNLSKAHRLCGD